MKTIFYPCAILLSFMLMAFSGLPAIAGPLQAVSVIDPALGSSAGGDGDSHAPIISADGRYVLFSSTADNLILYGSNSPMPTLIPASLNVFLHDRTNGTTTLVSVNLAGTGGGDGDSIPVDISTNGQFVLFESSATDLVANDFNNVSDVFVRDLVNGTTLLASVNINGVSGNDVSQGSTMTPDGRFVVFGSAASDLVAGDTNGIADIFVRDLQAGTTTLVSAGAIASPFGPPETASELPEISADGRYIAFFSTATNLAPGVTFGSGPLFDVGEIYLWDTTTGTITWVSAAARTIISTILGATNTVSYDHLISTNGQYVAYEASPTSSLAGVILRYNLATGLTDTVNTNAYGVDAFYDQTQNLDMTPDGRFIAFLANVTNALGVSVAVYVWDAQTATTTLVSGDLTNGIPPNSNCASPTIDATGRFVAFLSDATGLATNSLNGDFHLYIRDLQAGTTQLAAVDATGAGAEVSGGTSPSLSANGGLVAFECLNGNLVPNDTSRTYDVFVQDLRTNTIELISARAPALASLTANGDSLISSASISTDGRYVAFVSVADNLTANVKSGYQDVYVRDLLTGSNILASIAVDGVSTGNGPSSAPSLSADGRYVAFVSPATNLVPDDTNNIFGYSEIFVRDLQEGTTTQISVATDGVTPGNAASGSPAISADGRYVFFESLAVNLAPVEFSFSENLFQRDRQTGATYGITTNGLGSFSSTPDGRFIAFTTLPEQKAYVWDQQAGSVVYTNSDSHLANGVVISSDGQRIAYNATGGIREADVAGNTNWAVANAGTPPSLQLSGDGRFLVYTTSLPQVTNDVNGMYDVYLYDAQTGTNLLVSQSYNSSAGGNGTSKLPAISSDGRFIAYRSAASNIVLNDTNGEPDLFLYDRTTGITTLVTVSRFGNWTANNLSTQGFFSGDSRTLVFQSAASDLIAGDLNNSVDVFALQLYPTNAPPPLVAQIGAPNMPFSLIWPVAAGKAYYVQFKDGLDDPAWQNLNGSLTIIGGTGYAVDLAPGTGQRFYRIVSH